METLPYVLGRPPVQVAVGWLMGRHGRSRAQWVPGLVRMSRQHVER